MFTSLSLLPAKASIASDEDVCAQFKEYSKMWQLKKLDGSESGRECFKYRSSEDVKKA